VYFLALRYGLISRSRSSLALSRNTFSIIPSRSLARTRTVN
jgi:hypothetical protein